MPRIMYDAVTPENIPSGATMVAGYADGGFANLPTLHSLFPHARIVSIAVSWHTRANVLDVENGDATPADAVVWCTATMADKANGELTVYCNTDTWPAVRSAFHTAGITEPNYWVAAYDGDPAIPPGAIAKQWRGDVAPGYDQSAVADYWPGVDPAPTSAPVSEEDDMPTFTIDSTGGGQTFPRGKYGNVAFFCDNTYHGQPPAELRVAIFATGQGADVHQQVQVTSTDQTVIHFADPSMTHSIEVIRKDGGTFPVRAEIS